MAWVVLALVAAVCVALFFGALKQGIAMGTTIALAGADEFNFGIVGESNYQAALESIAGRSDASAEYECMALLVPEPSNPYDRNAIRVEIGGQRVGYISREETSAFHRVLNGRAAQVEAMITGGWLRRGKAAKFGVKLNLERPLREIRS